MVKGAANGYTHYQEDSMRIYHDIYIVFTQRRFPEAIPPPEKETICKEPYPTKHLSKIFF